MTDVATVDPLIHQAELNLFKFVFGTLERLGDTEEEAWAKLDEKIKNDIRDFVAKYPPGKRTRQLI